jgi:TonB family protein
VKPVRRPKVCPECSFENHHSDLFCKGCAAPLTDSLSGFPSQGSTHGGAVSRPPEELGKADAAVPVVASQQAPESKRGAAESSVGASAAPSLKASGEAPAAAGCGEAQSSKPRRPGARALGIVALGVGLGVLIPLVHFHRTARAQGKQFSVVNAAFVTRASSPAPAGPTQTDSTDQGLRSPTLNLLGNHLPPRPERREMRSVRELPGLVRPAREESLESVNAENKTTDVPKLTSTAGAPAIASGAPQPEVPATLQPVSTTVHSEVEKEITSVNEGPQKPIPLVLISRQIPAALPSNTLASPPSETGPGLISPATVPATTLERASVVQQARLLSRPALVYPSLALEARVQGDVHLEANALADGTVADVRVMSGILMLNDAAVALVKNSRYQPALVDGRPVRSFVDVTISFRLPR